MIVVRERKTGKTIEIVESVEAGKKLIEKNERIDKNVGIYEENFYEVAEVEEYKGKTEEQRKRHNQFELFTQIIELTNQLDNVNLLKIVSDNALAEIDAIKLKEQILVDNTETYKFDDTMRYDD